MDLSRFGPIRGQYWSFQLSTRKIIEYGHFPKLFIRHVRCALQSVKHPRDRTMTSCVNVERRNLTQPSVPCREPSTESTFTAQAPTERVWDSFVEVTLKRSMSSVIFLTCQGGRHVAHHHFSQLNVIFRSPPYLCQVESARVAVKKTGTMFGIKTTQRE